MKSKSNFLTLIIFIFSPFLAIPLVIDQVALRQKYAYYLLAIVFGLVVYMYEPRLAYDLARYYEDYESISRLTSIDQLSDFLEWRNDYFQYVISYILSRVGLGFQFYVLGVTIINMLLVFSVFSDLIENYFTDKKTFIILFTFFLVMINFEWIIGVSRQFTAFAFSLYAYYFGIWKNRRSSDFLILFVFLIHSSTILLTIIYFISKYIIKKEIYVKYIFYFSFIMYVLPSNSSSKFIENILMPNISEMSTEKYNSKIEGYGVKGHNRLIDAKKDLNTYGRVSRFVNGTIPFFLVLMFSLFVVQNFDKFYYILFSVANFTYGTQSIHGRFLSFAYMIFAIFYIHRILKQKQITLLDYVFISSMVIIKIFFFLLGYGGFLFDIFSDIRAFTLVTILSKHIDYFTLR